MTLFGDRESFAFELRALAGSPLESDDSAAATWVALQIWVQGKNLAKHTHTAAERYHDALHWPVIYLARWLVSSWSYFYETQRWPIAGSWRNARETCRALDRLVLEHESSDDEEAFEHFLQKRDDFVLSHALRAGVAGGLVPDLYLARDGGRVSIAWASDDDTGTTVFHHRGTEADVSPSTFLTAVRGLVAWCSERLEKKESAVAREDHERFSGWLSRLQTPDAARSSLSGYVGVSMEALTKVLGNMSIEEAFDLPPDWQTHGANFDPSCSGAAIVFRALSPILSSEEVVQILERLRQYPHSPCPELGRLQHAMPSLLNIRRDYEAGCHLAAFVRQQIGNPDRYIDIEAVVRNWGVNIEEFPISDPNTDGGCVWDASHGPVILLNPQSARTASSWGRRMVIAHELCHLLQDRSSAANLKVISGPWAPPTLERRADAFAAEILLPKMGIIRVLGIPTSMPTDADLEKLMGMFQVGYTTCVNRLRDLFRIGLD